MLQLPIREKDNVMLLFPPYCEMAHGLVQEQQSISQSRQKKRDECRLQEGTDLFPLWIKTPHPSSPRSTGAP